MKELWLKIYRPLFSLAFFVLGASFLLTYVTIRLAAEHFQVGSIGFLSSIYYGGIFVGSYFIEKWIAKHGNAKIAAISILGFGLSSLSMSLWIHGLYWAILRFIAGICTAGVYVSLESWLVLISSSKTRGQILSFYMIALYVSYALGQFLLNVGSIQSPYAFSIVAICTLVAAPWITHTPQVCPIKPTSSSISIRALFKRVPLGTMGALSAGLILSVIYALLPIYAKERQLDISEIATLMFLLVAGGLLFQWPLGKLSDHIDRRYVLLGSSLIALIISLVLGVINGKYLMILSLFLGGFTFCLYPLSTTHACDLSDEKEIVKLISAMILVYGFGALLGPLMASLVMTWIGSSGLFYFVDGILGIMILSTLTHFLCRAAAKKEEKIQFFPLSATKKGILLQPNRKFHEE